MANYKFIKQIYQNLGFFVRPAVHFLETLEK